MIYYLNNQFIANNTYAIDVYDRGFLLGDGVFTTLKSISGRLISLDKHIQRLNANTQQIKINLVLDVNEINTICQELLLKNNLLNSDAVIRITLTRGVGERGINIPQEQVPTLLISAAPYKNSNLPSINLCTTSIIRFEKSITSQIKSLNYLEAILARDEAIANGFDDAILLNSVGHVACTTVANIFFIHKNGELVTPPISDGVLAGVVRSNIIDRCHKNNIKFKESSIKLSDLDDYSGCFITNSIIGIQTINKINTKTFDRDNVVIGNILKQYNYK